MMGTGRLGGPDPGRAREGEGECQNAQKQREGRLTDLRGGIASVSVPYRSVLLRQTKGLIQCPNILFVGRVLIG